jgi:hypothetical protein
MSNVNMTDNEAIALAETVVSPLFLLIAPHEETTIGTCVREGIVIRSVPEAWDPKLGRKIIKLKGRGYKLFKD